MRQASVIMSPVHRQSCPTRTPASRSRDSNHSCTALYLVNVHEVHVLLLEVLDRLLVADLGHVVQLRAHVGVLVWRIGQLLLLLS